MNGELDAIPPARRRRMAWALAPLGLVLLVTGILTASLDGLGWKLAGLLVAGLAVVLLGVAWGLHRSAVLTEAAAAERRLDEVLVAAAGSSGAPCAGAGGAICGTTGLACGAVSATGCGASCMTRPG